MSIPQPTKYRIRHIKIKGIDLSQLFVELRVDEDIEKAYLTGTVIFNDTTNLIENMKVTSGDEVSFAMDAGEGQIYEQKLKVDKVEGQSIPGARLRTIQYTITLKGDEFSRDRAEQVQRSFRNTTGTQAIQRIFQEFLGGGNLRILEQSVGPLSRLPYVVHSRHPLQAIGDIIRRSRFSSTPTGTALFFRDRDGHVLAPLARLFQGGSVATYEQRQTWGANFFGDIVAAQFAVMDVRISTPPRTDSSQAPPPGGRGDLASLIQSASQGQQVFDFNTRSIVRALGARVLPSQAGNLLGGLGGISGILGTIRRGQGGRPNFNLLDSLHLPLAQSHLNNLMEGHLFRAQVSSGVILTVTVPIQGGLYATVGKNVNLKLLPSSGDLFIASTNLSGKYLVFKLTHTFKAERNGPISATTTMQCRRPGVTQT